MNVGLGVVKVATYCTAKWADTVEVYQIDKQNVLYRVRCKLTDRHLKPLAQGAMKVSLAPQEMGNTVAAAI
jgi:hypothetical protein